MLRCTNCGERFDEKEQEFPCSVKRKLTVYCSGSVSLDEDGEVIGDPVDVEEFESDIDEEEVIYVECPECYHEDTLVPGEGHGDSVVYDDSVPFNAEDPPNRYVMFGGGSFNSNVHYGHGSNGNELLAAGRDHDRWIFIVVDLSDNEVVSHHQAVGSVIAEFGSWLKKRKADGVSYGDMPAVRSEADELADLLKGM